MGQIKAARRIDAPVDEVFRIVGDIRNFSKAIPHITNIEFVSEQKFGKGTRFRETRVMNGREETTELEVTEFVENESIRLVADSHGTVWDTTFSIKPAAKGGTDLEMTMDSRPYKLFPMLVFPLIRKSIAKAVEQDMDSVKEFCES